MLDDANSEWQSHFDPHLDVLFGKGGLNDLLWRGEMYFESIDQAPQVVLQMLEDHVNQQYEQIRVDAE